MGNGMRGRDGGGGGGGNINVLNATDIWSFRHAQGNAPFVDAINDGLNKIDGDFPGFANTINSVDAVTMSGSNATMTLGFWSPSDGQLGINQNYTDITTMNQVMDAAAASGFHPSRGNLSGTEAVALHEGGHAMSSYLANKNGYKGLHEFSEQVVKNAYAASGATGGVKRYAGTISRYAQTNYAETVAEATADWYCNGSNASAASIAIMAELQKYA